MIEIMLWEPIDRVLGIDLSSWIKRRTLSGLRRRLVDSELNERIKSSAADKVSRAINVCLTGGKALGLEDNRDDKPSAKAALQDAFTRK
jgi:hypothetical protein